LFFYETPCFMRGFFMKTAVEGKTFCPTAAPHHITFGEQVNIRGITFLPKISNRKWNITLGGCSPVHHKVM